MSSFEGYIKQSNKFGDSSVYINSLKVIGLASSVISGYQAGKLAGFALLSLGSKAMEKTINAPTLFKNMVFIQLCGVVGLLNVKKIVII